MSQDLNKRWNHTLFKAALPCQFVVILRMLHLAVESNHGAAAMFPVQKKIQHSSRPMYVLLLLMNCKYIIPSQTEESGMCVKIWWRCIVIQMFTVQSDNHGVPLDSSTKKSLVQGNLCATLDVFEPTSALYHVLSCNMYF